MLRNFLPNPRPELPVKPPTETHQQVHAQSGRPGYLTLTMEMNGGSSAPHLACTPCVPLFVHCLVRVEAEGLLDYQGRAGIISIVRWNLRPGHIRCRTSFCRAGRDKSCLGWLITLQHGLFMLGVQTWKV